MNAAEMNVRSGQVVDAAMRVHSALGPGLLIPIHEAQLLSYLKLSGIKLGLLINLHEHQLKDGIKRMIL
jgi:hypothetical protein